MDIIEIDELWLFERMSPRVPSDTDVESFVEKVSILTDGDDGTDDDRELAYVGLF